MKNPIKNPWTTITGIVLLVLSVLSLLQVITKDQEIALIEYSAIIIEAIAGVVALLAKDNGGGL